jgi:hypothetical protein
MRRGVLLAVLLAALPARADDARETMRKALGHSLLGFDHARLVVSLVVRSGPADPGEARQIVVRTRRRGERMDRHLCFLQPADVKNTTFLSVAGEREEQFLWLPELGRLRQVSRASRSEPFLGTTFSYRDLEGWALDDATYRRIGEEAIGAHACQVIEATMKPGVGGDYGRIVSWVRKSDYMPLRVQLFDPAGKLAKTLFTRRIDRQSESGLAYARAVKMDDARTGASTLLEIEQADFAARFDPATFTPDHLRRGLDCAP